MAETKPASACDLLNAAAAIEQHHPNFKIDRVVVARSQLIELGAALRHMIPNLAPDAVVNVGDSITICGVRFEASDA